MGRMDEVKDLVLDDIIEYLNKFDNGGEYYPAIDNHMEVFRQYGIDEGYCEIIQEYGDLIESRGDLKDFLQDYYKSVIKSVSNVIETFKEGVSDGRTKNM